MKVCEKNFCEIQFVVFVARWSRSVANSIVSTTITVIKTKTSHIPLPAMPSLRG